MLVQVIAASLVFVAFNLCAAGMRAAPELRINLASPQDFQVVQRSSKTSGGLTVAGSISGESRNDQHPDTLEVRVLGKSPFGKLSEKWQSLPCDAHDVAFAGKLNLLAGGWYRFEARAFCRGTLVASAVVGHVGVGEVFVIGGQSNSANYGEERQNTKTGLVSTFDGKSWQLANDPQPGADGTKGSFMPLFGDQMVEHFHVPVGIVATGIGSTSVREWLPKGTRLARLPTLTRNVVTNSEGQWEASGIIFQNFTARLERLGTNGFRAVLWHQGESDAHQADPKRTLSGELYRLYLQQLIHDSRQTIGWAVAWFVAQASYHNPNDTASTDIRAAQKSLWDEGVALQGPDTDTLIGDLREKKGGGIHMSAKGLKAHAQLWFDKVSPWIEKQLTEVPESRN